jgi:hypothetical protein
MTTNQDYYTFIAEPGPYALAKALDDRLSAEGIRCNITGGGLQFYPTLEQVTLALSICKEMGISCRAGYSSQHEDATLSYGSPESRQKLIEVTDKANALLKVMNL